AYCSPLSVVSVAINAPGEGTVPADGFQMIKFNFGLELVGPQVQSTWQLFSSMWGAVGEKEYKWDALPKSTVDRGKRRTMNRRGKFQGAMVGPDFKNCGISSVLRVHSAVRAARRSYLSAIPSLAALASGSSSCCADRRASCARRRQ